MYIKVLATTLSELASSSTPLVKYFDLCEERFDTPEQALEHMSNWFIENAEDRSIYEFYEKNNRKPAIKFLRTSADPLFEEEQILLPQASHTQEQMINPEILEYAKMQEEDVLLLGLYYAYFDKGESLAKDLEIAKGKLVYDFEERLTYEEFVESQVEKGELPQLKADATAEEEQEHEELIQKLVNEKYKEIDMLWFRA